MARRGPLLAAIAAGTVLVGPVTIARASDAGIRASIDAYNHRVAADEARIVAAAAAYNRTGRPAPLVKALTGEVRDLRTLQGRLVHQPASTARGRRGRDDVVRGLGLIASGYSALAGDVRAAGARRPVTAAQVSAARAADRRGHNLVVAGLRLLSG